VAVVEANAHGFSARTTARIWHIRCLATRAFHETKNLLAARVAHCAFNARNKSKRADDPSREKETTPVFFSASGWIKYTWVVSDRVTCRLIFWPVVRSIEIAPTHSARRKEIGRLPWGHS